MGPEPEHVLGRRPHHRRSAGAVVAGDPVSEPADDRHGPAGELSLHQVGRGRDEVHGGGIGLGALQPGQVTAVPKEGPPVQLPFQRDGGAIDVDLQGRSADDLTQLVVDWPSSSLRQLTPGVLRRFSVRICMVGGGPCVTRSRYHQAYAP